ncbi:hypothetical protein RHOFW510R12_04060 [Rhodanobacter sp. FW510-R12]
MRPGTADNIAEDPHALLRAAHIGPPYVLVGHSMSGLTARVFVDRYPDGMVSLAVPCPGATSWQAPPFIPPLLRQLMTSSQQASKPPLPAVRWILQATPWGPGLPQSTRAASGSEMRMHAASISPALAMAAARARVFSVMGCGSTFVPAAISTMSTGVAGSIRISPSGRVTGIS